MAEAVFAQFLTGFSIVAILLIISLGLAIIFGVMRVINMAHGDFIMIGAYVAYVLQYYLHLNLFWAVPAAFVVLGLLGMVVEWGLIRQLYGRPLETLLATWGVSIILQAGIRLAFGPELRYVKAPDALSGEFPVPGSNLPFPYFWMFIIVLALVLLLLTYWLLYRTDLGMHVRAVNQNRAMAAVLGIDTRRIDSLVFAFGSGLAGIAGVVVAPIKTVSPIMGFKYAVDSYMVIVLGGVGRLAGTLAGATVIGEGETVLAFLFNNVIGELLVFTMIVLVIRVFPQGLFTIQHRRTENL
ncbi:MAG: urea ABC transporter permease subunit UrtB [Candidatus Rokuibacteriota bacterium]|nr:MAG: urea ABC transporter permease subunit UrtB [Candidatus Rokubacteria bacterium]